MNLRALNTAHRRAAKAEREQHIQCENMASELQEFFDHEITVLFQEGDGFVVLHNDKEFENCNTPVEEVVAAVLKDKDAFR